MCCINDFSGYMSVEMEDEDSMNEKMRMNQNQVANLYPWSKITCQMFIPESWASHVHIYLCIHDIHVM